MVRQVEKQVLNEAVKALRLARRYRGTKFGRDELEYAGILLGELEVREVRC